MKNNNELIVAVAELRMRLGLSQTEFAHELDMALPTISGAETGYRRISPKLLFRLRGLAKKHRQPDLERKFHDGFINYFSRS